MARLLAGIRSSVAELLDATALREMGARATKKPKPGTLTPYAEQVARKMMRSRICSGPQSMETVVVAANLLERRTYVTESRRRGESSERGESSGVEGGGARRSNETVGSLWMTFCTGVRGFASSSSSTVALVTRTSDGTRHTVLLLPCGLLLPQERGPSAAGRPAGRTCR